MSKKCATKQKILSFPDAAQIKSYFTGMGLNLAQIEAEALAIYLKHLLIWNKKMNLVGFSDWKNICAYLLIDSWYLARFIGSIDLPAFPLVLDLGAGAGLPGIALRVFWPAGHYIMIESRQKRSAFLQYVLSHLDLVATQVLCMRVENLPVKMKEADLIVSRAFCPWPELLSLTRKFVNKQGRLIVLANQPWIEDQTCLRGWKIQCCKEYLAAGKKRYFWLFAPISASN